MRYALARPNARSSHRVPTPQGGGIAVIAATLAIAGMLAPAFGLPLPAGFTGLCAATVALAALGALDDIRPLSPLLRLLGQFAAVLVVVALVPPPARLLPEAVPPLLERVLLVVAGVWWVNLVNFMDGIDWITVAEFVPMTACLALLGAAGHLPPADAALAAALCGGLLGFAPSNRPVATLFLGDVGSLPVGLLTGALLLGLAGAGHLAAACILPLFYLADATLTLGRRAARGERVWEAHRSHFYQRALDRGWTVLSVDGLVLALNLLLAGLATAAILADRPLVDAAALLAAGLAVGLVLLLLARGRSV